MRYVLTQFFNVFIETTQFLGSLGCIVLCCVGLAKLKTQSHTDKLLVQFLKISKKPLDINQELQEAAAVACVWLSVITSLLQSQGPRNYYPQRPHGIPNGGAYSRCTS